MGDAILKVVLTFSTTTKAYDIDSTDNRILDISHKEQEWSQTHQITVDNREGNLTTLTLQGYKGVISDGYHTGVARSAWVKNTEYSLGDYVVPTAANVNGYQYKCTTAGFSDASDENEPTWGASLGGTTDDYGTLVWTLDGKDGDEYSASAPVTVIAQKADTVQGDLVTTFSLAGLFNLWGEQEALEAYTPDDSNGDTVKDILDAIAAPSLDCFSGYPAHTITYDTNNSDDGIIDTFTPKDYFSIAKGESRLSAFKKALAYTKCKALVKNDSGTATIHIFIPTISGNAWVASTAYIVGDYVQPTTPTYLFAYRCTTAGTSYSSDPTWPTTAGGTVTEQGSSLVWTAVAFDYEYNDAEGLTYHDFFSKSVRTRLVLPNKVVVMNHPDHEDSYTGNATDAASYAALGNQYYTKTIYARPASNAQCTLMAKAALQRYQIAAEKGHGVAPLNCGQEVMDYVKITDSVASDLRIGNVGYIHRWYSYRDRQPTRFGMEFRFGTLEVLGLAGTVPPKQTKITIEEPPSYQALIDQVASLIEDYNSLRDALIEVIGTANSIIEYLLAREMEQVIAKLHVTQQLIIPVWIPGTPTVTTQDTSPIAAATATGNGTITDLGVPDPTQYGVCWDTSTSPTTTDSGSGKWGKTEEGAATETGTYTSSLTNLTAATDYYLRTYATNATGTAYGIQNTFTTLAS